MLTLRKSWTSLWEIQLENSEKGLILQVIKWLLKDFFKEWEVAKVRQDKALDNIEKGLGVLKGIGQAMGENLSQQDILLDEIGSKVHFPAKYF